MKAKIMVKEPTMTNPATFSILLSASLLLSILLASELRKNGNKCTTPAVRPKRVTLTPIVLAI